MSEKDKILVLYDKGDGLIATVVFNKTIEEDGYNVLLDDIIIKIIIDNREHKLVD